MATRGRGVGALEPPAFVLPPRNVRSTLWGRALFSCTVSGSPEPTVTWWHDGVALTSGGRGCAQRSRPGAYSLEIRGLVAADAGRYECEASNDAGSCRLAVQLTVEDPRSPTSRQQEAKEPRPFDAKHHRGGVLQTPWQESPPRFAQKPSGALVKEGGTARFSCRPTGRPSPTVAWHRSGVELTPGGRVAFGEADGVHWLAVADVGAGDAGSYACVLANAAGTVSASTELRLQGGGGGGASETSPPPAAPWRLERTERQRNGDTVSPAPLLAELATRSARGKTEFLPARRSVASDTGMDGGTGSSAVIGAGSVERMEASSHEPQLEERRDSQSSSVHSEPSPELNDKEEEEDAGGSEHSRVVMPEEGERPHVPLMNGHVRPTDSEAPDSAQVPAPGQECGAPSPQLKVHGGVTLGGFDSEGMPGSDQEASLQQNRSLQDERLSDAVPQRPGVDVARHNAEEEEEEVEARDQGGVHVDPVEAWEGLATATPRTDSDEMDDSVPSSSAQLVETSNATDTASLGGTVENADASVAAAAANIVCGARSSEAVDATCDAGTANAVETGDDAADVGDIGDVGDVGDVGDAVPPCVFSVPPATVALAVGDGSSRESSEEEKDVAFSDPVNVAAPLGNGDEVAAPGDGEGDGGRRSAREENEAAPRDAGPPELQGPHQVTVSAGNCVTATFCLSGHGPFTVHWLRSKAAVEEGARVRLAMDEGSAALSIAPARREDSGCYSLSVSNAHGSTTVPCNITVLDRPEPPRGCPQVSPRKDGSLALSWSGPADDGGSAVEAYVVEGQRCDAQDGDGAWTELSGSCASTSLTLDSLESGSGWRFRVRARNAHGLGDAGPESQLVTVGNADEAESEPEHHDVVVRTDKKVMDLFERLDKLGTGKFGQVFRLREKSSGREWAGKFSRARRREERENLRREVDIMNSLRHPRIVQCLAAFEAPTEITIVLEYVSGGELFERVSDDDFELTERECVEYMRQILDGVGFIHRQHIVHLDLKPENIMCVNRTGTRIKIIDFGLARRIEPGVPLKVMFGTPEFVAPEVIAFEPVTFVTDMWSIGVICYILVSGISPLAGDTDVETMANVTSCNWDFDDDGFADISEDCKDLIGKMIEKDVKKRWTCEQCVQHPWVQSSPERLEPKQLNKERMRSYITRRKWQKTVHAVRAVGRLAALNAAHMGSTNATATPVSPVSPASPQ
ncbi:uncharacterized protein LOC144934406 isoform X2 [Lampetra fluviatilis]